jgi:propionyl-CoA carboxylase alpha chain
MFESLLIANRGEVAARIARTCRRLGVRTVAVYSDADQHEPFVGLADRAVAIGGERAEDSYLAAERILDVARDNGVQAIHPGFGFLSENPAFAEAVTAAGLRFVGPPAAAMALLGDKMAAKALAEKAGLQVLSAADRPAADVAAARAEADRVGYPVLLKPAAGGGGKGMRVVAAAEELEAALASCRAEAAQAFGDDRVFVERYLTQARHVEVQVLADDHGRVIHLGERECSVQRRHQKVIEEAPSPAVDTALRRRMGRLACALAQEAGYRNAGTVEFLLAPDGALYFLEMNTRLQVEHPVTEQITGLDLVELQLRIACGEPLDIDPDRLELQGWAIEARICAEDASRDFAPSTGIVTRYAEPRGHHLRIDSGIEAGSQVGFHYDSMLAKVIAWGATREQARGRLIHALNGYLIEGPTTNIDFVTAVLGHPAFAAGRLATDFLARHFPGGRSDQPPAAETLQRMSLAAAMVYHNRQNLVRESLKPMAARAGGERRAREHVDYVIQAGDDVFQLRLEARPLGRNWRFRIGDRDYQVQAPDFEFYQRRLRLEIDGRPQRFRMQYRGNFIEVGHGGLQRTFEIYSPREWELAAYMPAPQPAERNDVLECPMPGAVVRVEVGAGERVYRRQPLVVIESMKMESVVSSPRDGEVAAVLVEPGQIVDAGETLIRFV